MPPTLDNYAATLQSLLSACAATGNGAKPFIFVDAVSAVTSRIAALRGTPKKVIAIGNGGSAAVANLFVLDLWNYSGVKAISFADASLLTCMSNDYGYENVFRKPIGMFAETGDILVAISSSGKSQNIIHAVDEAMARGLWCVTMSGFKPDNPLSRKGHVNFFINSGAYGMVELAHAVLCHYVSDILAEK